MLFWVWPQIYVGVIAPYKTIQQHCTVELAAVFSWLSMLWNASMNNECVIYFANVLSCATGHVMFARFACQTLASIMTWRNRGEQLQSINGIIYFYIFFTCGVTLSNIWKQAVGKTHGLKTPVLVIGGENGSCSTNAARPEYGNAITICVCAMVTAFVSCPYWGMVICRNLCAHH